MTRRGSRDGTHFRRRLFIADGPVERILILLVIVLAARGCGKISHRTPEVVVEGYIKAAAAGKNKKMQGCYSADKLSDEAKTEISSTIKY